MTSADTAGRGGTVDTVLFDLGQVLVRWEPGRTFVGVLDDAEIAAFVDGPFGGLNRHLDRARAWVDVRPELARTAPSEHVALLDVYVERFPASLTGPVPGTAEIVDELRFRGVRLFGLTNWPGELFRHAAVAAPAIGHLEGVVVSGCEGISKPDPAVFRLAAERFGLEPARTLFVDDSPPNVEAAGMLGFHTHLFDGAQGLRTALHGLRLLPSAG